MSEVTRSEKTDTKKQIDFRNDKFSANIYSDYGKVKIIYIGMGTSFNIVKEHIPDHIAVLQAVQNELEPQKKNASADNPLLKNKADAWLSGGKIGQSDNDNFYCDRNSSEIYFRKFFKIIDDDIRFDIKLFPEFARFVQDVQEKLAKKKPLITAADWRDYFTNEADMMSYNVERAKAEFDNRIKHIYKLGWQNGKAEIANHISMKKWIAIANGNMKYRGSFPCGYCFAWVSYVSVNRCLSCLYKKFHPQTDMNCNIAEPDEMIRRFQNPELLKLIEEYDREKK